MRLSLLLLAALAHGSAVDSARAEDTPKDAGHSKQSIRRFATCDGRTDDAQGAARAFAAAKNDAFTLVIDCPLRIHVGMDIARTIFIDEGTSVEFAGAGKITVDNLFIPAFAIANSSHIHLSGWNIEYDAALPVNPKVGGHALNGRFVQGSAPANAFNDAALTPWLAANRRIVFDRGGGAPVNSRWSGATNIAAIFFIIGDCADLRVTGMHLYAPPAAGAERFIPVAFAFDPNYKSNQTVSAATPFTSAYVAVPHDLRFSDITLDGTYMGWVGGVRQAVFENIKSHRYADLQDASGAYVGGTGKWFAPPHLFYLSYPSNADEGLVNKDIQIANVIDDGPRIGTARDKGGTDSLSGYALSLKIGCVHCSVDNYKTTRPDGFLDVLPSDGLTISNVDASYDSSFLNNVFPGWRFPGPPYRNLSFRNIAFSDTAAVSVKPPIGDANQASNEAIAFSNVRVTLNRWAGGAAGPLPKIAGRGNEVALDYVVRADRARIVESRQGGTDLILRARPFEANAPAAVALEWSAQGASSCAAHGPWSGELPASGSRTVTLERPGTFDFVLECGADATARSRVTAEVTVAEGSGR